MLSTRNAEMVTPFAQRTEFTSIGWPVVLLSLYLLGIWLFVPVFFSPPNLVSVAYSTSLLIPAVLGVHLLLILGLFDLSIGAVAAMSGMACAVTIAHGAPATTAVAVGLASGAAFGALSAVLVSSLRIPALIGTLVTMGIARALALGLTEGRVLSDFPDKLKSVASIHIGALPLLCLLGVAAVALAECVERRHVVFRMFYRVGDNREAARNCGINVGGTEYLAFLLAGSAAAITGILQASRSNSASPIVFGDLALESIAACVIGGTKLQGGSGRAIGALCGLLVVVISRNLTVLAGVSVYWKDLVIALLLLASLLVSRLPEGRRAREGNSS